MRDDKVEVLLWELRAIRELLLKVANQLIVATGVPEPDAHCFTLYQPGDKDRAEQVIVCSLRELERNLNRQRLLVEKEQGPCGYAVYEADIRMPTGKWLVGYLDRPFAPAAVTH